MTLDVNKVEVMSVDDLEKIAVDVACFLHQQRAENIRILRQVRNFGDAVERHLKPLHLPRLGIHGRNDARWFCIDHGEIVLHLFDDEARDLYDLDQLWGHAPKVDVDFKALITSTAQPEENEID